MRKDEKLLEKIKKEMKVTGWSRNKLFRIPGGHLFEVMLMLYERVDRRMKKSRDKKAVLRFKHRMAEDIIRFMCWYGEIPQDPFIIKTLCSWIKESKTEYLIDLGRALAGEGLTQARSVPYILVKTDYDILMKSYPPDNPVVKQNEVLLLISMCRNLKVNYIKQILIKRGLSDSYVSPFTMFSRKEAEIAEGVIWDAKRRKKTHKEIANSLQCRPGTVRVRIRETKKMLGLQEKDSKGKRLSDDEREKEAHKMVEDMAKRWFNSS